MIVLPVHGQKKISPEWITVDDGLSQGFISALYQDTDGFLWVGTKSGLDRYDGREFQNFTKNSIDLTNLQNEQIRSISGDQGFVLVATEGDLYLYLAEYRKFYPFNLGYGVGQIYKQNTTTFLLVAIDGSVIKLQVKKDITLLADKNLEISTCFTTEKNESIKVNSYFKLSNFQEGFIYFQKEDKYKSLMYFNVKTEKPEPLPKFEHSQVQSNYKIGYVAFDNSILVYTDTNFFVLHEGIWKKFKASLNIVNALHLKKKRKVVISTLDEYLLFDYASIIEGKMQASDASLIYPTQKTQFYNILEDYSDNLWIGTVGYGLMKVNNRQTKIQHFFEDKSIYVQPFVSIKGTVFLNNPTTEEKLIIPGDSFESEQIKQFSEQHKEVNFVQNTKDNSIWGLAITSNIIKLYKLTASGFTFFSSFETDFDHHIRLFDIEPYSNQLIIAIGDRLLFWDLSSGDMNAYLHKMDLDLFSLFVENSNRFWIGAQQGLLRIEKKGERISHKFMNSENSNLLSNQAASIHQDKDDLNKLWIGTKGGGLHRYDIKKGVFEPTDLKGEFPDNTIYGILEDDHQNLWLSSNKGLICYHKSSGNLKHFIKGDGLQGNEFNTYAYKKGNSGLFYFGGTNGLNIFNPEDLTHNKYLAKTFITDIQLNNQPLKSDISYEHLKELKLNYQQNNLSFRFASTELTAAKKNLFRYYLEGMEEEWAHVSQNNVANYLNLRPGNYTLKLTSSNSDGVWNPSYYALNILITPPWYESNLAYLGYFILLFLLMFGVVKFRESRINNILEKEKITLEKELLESRIAYKEKDLIDLANTISENEKWRDYLLNYLQKIQDARGKTKTSMYGDLINQIKIKTSIENSRIEYQKRIDTLNNAFNDNLLRQYPQLSKNDLRLCYLIKLDFTTKEIALIQNIEVKSVYINRSRLRKKMQLSNETDLVALLKKIS